MERIEMTPEEQEALAWARDFARNQAAEWQSWSPVWDVRAEALQALLDRLEDKP